MSRFFKYFSFFAKRKIFGLKKPLLANFKLTYQCNLRCRGCPFHLRAEETGAQISWKKAVEALEELKKRGCPIVVFEGGEPFLWKDESHNIKDIVVFAKSLFMSVAVTTNGTFFLDVPADLIWVSLDGLKETHDRLRSSSFDKIWENLKKAEHPKILVHFTLNRENWRETERLLDKLNNIPRYKGLTVQLFYPYGQGEQQLALSPEDRRKALEKVIKLKKEGYPVLNSENRLKAMIENTWSCHEEILINVDPDGVITTGCYVLNRGRVLCRNCGFTAVAEASGAIDLLPGSILSGWRTFIKGC